MGASESIQALGRVTEQAKQLAVVDDQSERGYAHLGWLLLQVASMQYWRVHFDTFRDYLQSVSRVSKRTVAQLQRYFLTVRDLSDTFDEGQLNTIGITKAMYLRRVKDYAMVFPPAVVQLALDPSATMKDLKKACVSFLPPNDENADWLDLDFAFYVSPEERATIEDAIKAAEHAEPITKTTVAESSQKKDIVLKWCMEFLSGHLPEGNS